MSIYQEGSGFGYEDFMRKDLAIAQLGNSDSRIRQRAMLELGLALSKDDRLTPEHHVILIEKLNRSGLLTYEREVYEESVKSGNSEEELSSRFDLAKWEMERNGKVQALVIAAAAQVSQEGIRDYDRVLRVADLLSKLQRIPKNIKIPLNVEPFTVSLARLAQVEEEIYFNRPVLVNDLVNIGIESPDKRAHVTARDLDGFKALSRESQLYNRIVALDFLRKSTADDIEGRFRELQGVAHYSYTKDIRDMKDFYTLYGGV